jgi:N-acetylglucosaminyldiphosphoundecaprenol N-acetyl-beta-D-mannosaminyltransferase
MSASLISNRSAVMGQPVDLLADYAAWLTTQMQQKIGVHVITLNAEMTMQAHQNPSLAAILQQAELVIPDGAGIVLYFQLYGQKISRCAGIELAAMMIEQAAQDQASAFFYGGKPGVAAAAASLLQQRLPQLNMAGVWDGYVQDEAAIVAQIEATQPRLILVGLGVPRQELWIAANRHRCPEAIWIGVGGSFDIWSGMKERAPEWFCRHNLEWLYRLYQEPWRWKRMSALPKFALRSLVHRAQNPRP